MKTCLENFSYIISTNLHFIFIIVHFKDHGVLSIGFASFSLPFVVIAIVVAFITVSISGGGPGSSQVQSAIMERVFLVLVAVVVMLLKILCIGCSLYMKIEEESVRNYQG